MIVERTTQGIMISTVHNGQLVHMHYIGYTKREAIEEFKEHLQEIDSMVIEEVAP